MRRLLQVVAEDWPRLLLEVLVLVLGISASFALEEWRSERADARVERLAWEAARDDLAADTSYLATRLASLAERRQAHDVLLAAAADGRTLPRDTLAVLLDVTIGYVAFRSTDNAYQELRQTGNARGIRNRALLGRLSGLHTRPYAIVAEWDAITSDFVRHRMIPFVDAASPVAYARLGADGSPDLATAWPVLRRDPRYRNLLATSRMFVDAQAAAYARALADARRLMARIDAEALGTPAQRDSVARADSVRRDSLARAARPTTR